MAGHHTGERRLDDAEREASLLIGRSAGHGAEEAGEDDLVGGELFVNLPLSEHVNAVTIAHDLFDFGGNKQHGQSISPEVGDQLFNFLFGADVDAAGGLVQNQQFGRGGQPAG